MKRQGRRKEREGAGLHTCLPPGRRRPTKFPIILRFMRSSNAASCPPTATKFQRAVASAKHLDHIPGPKDRICLPLRKCQAFSKLSPLPQASQTWLGFGMYPLLSSDVYKHRTITRMPTFSSTISSGLREGRNKGVLDLCSNVCNVLCLNKSVLFFFLHPRPLFWFA